MANLKTKQRRKTIQVDDASPVDARLGRRRLVVFVSIMLLLFGLIMVASASSGEEVIAGRAQWAIFQKQLIYAVVGLFGMWLAMNVPLEFVRRLGTIGLLLFFALTMSVIFLPEAISPTVNGAKRWVDLRVFQLQPSEPLKLAVVVFLADFLSRNRPPKAIFPDFAKSPGGFALFIAGALVTVQSDLGSAFMVAAVVFTLYMLAGTRLRILGNVFGVVGALVAISIITEPYRRERFLAFIDPWASQQADGYQLVQSLISIGSGGFFGVGLGHSVQKIAFLPEAHTDMIFAITVEELGVFGMLMILGAFTILAIVGITIARHAKTPFSKLLAAGITTMIIGQALVNIGGVTSLMPLTGIPLPLVSYGGSSLIMSLLALGLLANIATEKRPALIHPLPPRGAPKQAIEPDYDPTDDSDFEFDFDDEDFESEDDEYTNEFDESETENPRSSWRNRRPFSSGASSS